MDRITGILLINVGTPDAPEENAVREFLAEFLSDPLVVDYPRWVWLPILNKIILKKRPERSAILYRQIWNEKGSPLLQITESLAEKIRRQKVDWRVAVGMRYGKPSINSALEALRQHPISQLVILPLFPQYSSTTTLTSILAVKKALLAYPEFPTPLIIENYHDHPEYISGLAESIRTARINLGKPDRILFSYHGIPRRLVVKKGEPYQDQCLETTRLVAEKAGLEVEQARVGFQSRFGPESWIGPNTEEVLEELGRSGIKHLQVICPGFAADCLETLEEIAVGGKKLFDLAGDGEFHYIPALNDSNEHVNALISIIQSSLNE